MPNVCISKIQVLFLVIIDVLRTVVLCLFLSCENGVARVSCVTLLYPYTL